MKIQKSLSTSAVVVTLEHLFSQYGIPHVLISDNGPPFSGQLFASYLAQQGIQHRRVTPYWPQASGEADRFMHTIQKAIRAACSEGKDWKREINNFLLSYRATPHATTQHAPGHVMFVRDVRTKVPELSTSLPVQHTFEKLHVKDTTAKMKMKQHADLTRKAVQPTVKVGNRLLLKVLKVNKLSTPYHPESFTVVHKKGTMVTVKVANDQSYSRNVTFVKKVPQPFTSPQKGRKKGDAPGVALHKPSLFGRSQTTFVSNLGVMVLFSFFYCFVF